MRTFSFSAFIALLAILLTTACNDPTTIGADLLDDDRINTAQTDTITIKASSIYGERVPMYEDGSNLLSSFLVGNYEDPVFGKVTSNLAFEVAPSAGFKPSYLALDAVIDTIISVDSILLILPYNADNFYGPIEEVELELYQLTDSLMEETNYFSDGSIDIAMSPIATYTFTPAPLDSFIYFRDVTEVVDGVNTVVNRRFAKAPQLRLKLPESFSNDFITQDEMIWDSEDSFLGAYPGFYLRVVSDNGGMMSLNFNSNLSVITNNPGLEINTTGTPPAGESVGYETFISVNNNAIKVNEFRHDFAGTIVESIVDNNSDQDTILAVQSMEGVVGVLDIPYIENFKDLLINKAELTMTVLNLDGDDNFDPVDQIIISSVNNDGSFSIIDDLSFSAEAFGGSPITDTDGNITYTFNITAAIQEMSDGELETTGLALTVFNRAVSASRVILAGPKHPTNPMKLRIIYTQP